LSSAPAPYTTLFRSPHGEPESGFERVVLGGHVRTPDAVPLLQPQAVERRPAGGHDTVLTACRRQHLPEALPVLGAGVELPTQFTHVRHPHRGDRDACDADLLAAEELQPLVREVVPAQGLHEVASARAPHPDTAGAAGDVAQLHAAVLGQLAA